MREFLTRYIPEHPGAVLSESGEVIGRHSGARFYTLGQRHGFEVTKKTSDTPPLYVVDKDADANTLVVGSRRPDEVGMVREVVLEDVNWIFGAAPEDGRLVYVRFRHRQPLRRAYCRVRGSVYSVRFDECQNAVAPGQSLVVYSPAALSGGDVDECLGGGVVSSVE